jgi:erythromycin esterase
LAQAEEPFVKWARAKAAPIDASGRAFRTLDRTIAGARLIGVGESVHETEPFLSFRLQLLQDLVRRHRVTALLLESGLPEAMELNDYVRGRTATVDYDKVLPGGFGDLAEIRNTMEWLRQWNLGAGRRHPVNVYGADLPNRSGSMVPALDHLAELTKGHSDVQEAIDAVRPTAVRISGGWWKAAADKYAALSSEEKAGLTSSIATLVARVNALRGGNAEQLEWARRVALVASQSETMLRFGAFAPSSPRDQAMTDNTLWVLDRLPRGERAVYWAHNAHVQRALIKGPALPPGSFTGAGTRFETALGKRYVAIATAYGGPSMDKKTAPEGESVDGTLEKVGDGSFVLNLRGERRTRVVDAWLKAERPMRFQVGTLLLPLDAFDAVAWFDHADRAEKVSGK